MSPKIATIRNRIDMLKITNPSQCAELEREFESFVSQLEEFHRNWDHQSRETPKGEFFQGFHHCRSSMVEGLAEILGKK